MYGMYCNQPQTDSIFSFYEYFLGGWPPNASGAQYRPQYPPQTGPQQWAQGPRPGQPQGPNQWDQPRYPVNQQYGPVSLRLKHLNAVCLILFCSTYFRISNGQVKVDLHS